MDFNSLRTFFTRFSKDRLLGLYKEYKIGDALTKSGPTKDVLCRILAQEATKGKFSMEDLERLDLQYSQSCTNKKWTVYRMENPVLNRNFDLNDPEQFQKLFEKELKSCSMKCKVGILPQGNTLWLRIAIHLGNINLLLSPANTVYMVYVPGSSYIILSTLKIAFKLFVLKAIENLFHCDGINEIDLAGRKVSSLCNLTLNKNSQGSFSQCRLNQVDPNPLSRKRKREIDDSTIDQNDRMFNEQWSKDKKTRTQTRKAFGRNPQPILEKIEFKMESRFHGNENAPSLANTTVHCLVKFKGSNVLEGIKSLSEHDLASQPLPSHLTKIHSLSRNTFILTDKK